MDFNGYEKLVGFLLGAFMSGSLLILGRHVSRTPIEKLTEAGLIGRYIYGTFVLFIGNTIFLLFASDIAKLSVIFWLFGIAVVAGIIRILVGQWDIYRDNRTEKNERLEMLEVKERIKLSGKNNDKASN